jgi:large subunit ribosomal protein L3
MRKMQDAPLHAVTFFGGSGGIEEMSLGIVGRKCGMTRIFTEDGQSVPVTVIEVEPNRITQLKDEERDGYRAVQVTTGVRRARRVSRAAAGHLAKAGVEAGRGLWEFRLSGGEAPDLRVGGEVGLGIFEVGQQVDAVGTSIGKGYAGVVKRHNFRTQDASHGNSLAHRAPGSIGQNQTPGRVFKGKRMAGRMGGVRRTAPNLEVIRIDEERGVLLLRGAVPGFRGGDVLILPSAKAK